jgi:hypothetical protein
MTTAVAGPLVVAASAIGAHGISGDAAADILGSIFTVLLGTATLHKGLHSYASMIAKASRRDDDLLQVSRIFFKTTPLSLGHTQIGLGERVGAAAKDMVLSPIASAKKMYGIAKAMLESQDGAEVHYEPGVLDILRYAVSHRGDVLQTFANFAVTNRLLSRFSARNVLLCNTPLTKIEKADAMGGPAGSVPVSESLSDEPEQERH